MNLDMRMFIGSFAKEQMGGYAAALFTKLPTGVKKAVIEGTKLGTTTNEMDLIAIRDGLLKLKAEVRPSARVHIETRNRYAASVFNEWLAAWKESGWKRKDKSEIKNLALIKEIDSLMEEYAVVKIEYAKESDKFLQGVTDRARQLHESLAE